MRGAVHRILCIPRKLLETCRLRVRFCPAGIGRRLQRGGKQQKRRLAKSLTGHDCRDRHNSIGADYAESVHNSGRTKERAQQCSNRACESIGTRAPVAQALSLPRRQSCRRPSAQQETSQSRQNGSDQPKGSKKATQKHPKIANRTVVKVIKKQLNSLMLIHLTAIHAALKGRKTPAS